jgi:nicotinamidase-related amidase
MERAFGLEIPRTLEEVCRPDRLALLVYDMQAGIVVQLPDGAEVTRRVVDVVHAARAGGFRVFYTRHMSLPKELAGVSQLSTALAWQRVERVDQVKAPFLRDSSAFQLVPELTPLPTEAIFDKITMSAFVGTPLDIAMRDCGLNAFAIVGIAFEVGIEPTVRHAMDLGYIPVVVADGCGSRDKEAADRGLAGLRFTGGSYQTDVATIGRLMRGRASDATAPTTMTSRRG